MSCNTSLITILSSEHGRMRREQRDISKRDLQRALKYGTCERCFGRRWKVEYDGITFITDDTRRREVTAFPSPLAMAPVESADRTAHAKAKKIINAKPELTTSHTVLIVDCSGSMSTHDINLHRDRQAAAYSVTAMEFIAEQLFNDTANNKDVVSLIEFSADSQVVFKREPVSWVLYNKLLGRRDPRDFKSRQSAKAHDLFFCDSNYIPALEIAEELLAEGDHSDCALSMFFLSDGAPTDMKMLGLTPIAAQRRMCDHMTRIGTQFGERLTVSMVGFGSQLSDFSFLRAMSDAVESSPGGAKARFEYCDKMSNAIGAAVTSLVTSLTETRASIADGMRFGKTRRSVTSEKDTQKYSDWRYFRIVDHITFEPYFGGFIHNSGLPPAALRSENQVEVHRRGRNLPPLLAMNKHHCGRGVERVAFRCQLGKFFTYKYTNRKVMVCDLQGIYNTDMVPPTFELSDPAIHYRSNRGREMVYGRTDKGKKGIQLFFDSHKCSKVCQMMQLSKFNKHWKNDWQYFVTNGTLPPQK